MYIYIYIYVVWQEKEWDEIFATLLPIRVFKCGHVNAGAWWVQTQGKQI
jgi:hypothetical protein